MKFIRKVIANVNTEVLAHWYSLTEDEFNKIKQENQALNNPSSKLSVELVYWYDNFHLMTNTKNKTYHLAYFSKLENINPDQILMLIEEYRQTGRVYFSEKSISENMEDSKVVTEKDFIIDKKNPSWSVLKDGVIMAFGFQSEQDAIKYRNEAYFGYYSNCSISPPK
jgi:hypothetical protein